MKTFKETIAEHGVTPKEIAKKTGISKWTVYGWYSGRNPISFTAALKISNAFNIPLNELVYIEGNIILGR